MDWSAWRRRTLTEPLYRWARNGVSPFNVFQRRVLSAGDVWWEAQLLSGKPDWAALTYVRPVAFSTREKEFIDGPVAALCQLIEQSAAEGEALPTEQLWRFLAEHRFEAMAVPTEYGGVGLGAWAQSEVLHRVALRSVSVAYLLAARFVFGPAAVLKAAATPEQAGHWLARMGQGVACGSVASFAVENDIVPIQATGVVLHSPKGEPILRLNWRGARHAPGPRPALLVLPFRLHDPDGLIGPAGERGVCVALVDTSLPGVAHHPPSCTRANADAGMARAIAAEKVRGGVFDGRDVELRVSDLLGGEAMDKGLSALLAAQSAARGIALPALAAASVSLAAHAASAVSRLQGDGTGSEMLGARSRLGRLAATAYRIEAGRRFLCAGLDLGYRPILASALIDISVLEDVRSAMGDSMHLLGGAGPTPALTEWHEGLHELLPALFGLDGLAAQGRNTGVLALGMLRAHPYLSSEIRALGQSDVEAGCLAFDQLVWKHAGWASATTLRAVGRAWTGGRYSPVPRLLGPVARHYRRVNRYASALAVLMEVMQPGVRPLQARSEPGMERMLRALAVLVSLCAVLKRWQDDGRHDADLPLVDWCAADAFHSLDVLLDGMLKNLKAPAAGAVLKALLLPPAVGVAAPDDAITLLCADLLLERSDTRERVVGSVWGNHGLRHLGALEKAYECVINVEDLREQIRRAGLKDWRVAREHGGLTEAQAGALEAAEAAVIAALRGEEAVS